MPTARAATPEALRRATLDVPAWLLPSAAVALASFLFLCFAPALFGCGDTSWHLAAGRLILARAAVPTVDPFSFTFAGHPWVAHEWLAEVIMAGAFAVGGWPLLALLFAGTFGALIMVLGAALGRHLAPPALLVALALVVACLAPAALARPHMFAWGLLAVWTALLLRARAADRAPHWAAAVLMLVWANLHASFIFGLLLLGGFAFEAVLARDRLEALRGWAMFGLLALGASLVTPFGIHGLLFPLQVSAMQTLPMIVEWAPTDLLEQTGFLLFLLTGGYVAATHGLRVPPVRLLIILATLWLALAHARHQPVFAIVAVLLIAEPFARAGSLAPRRRVRLPILIGLIACATAGVAARLALPAAPKQPMTAIDALPPNLIRQPVFNDYAFGGPLILKGVHPYIDGRADMYGDAFMLGYGRIAGGDMAAFRQAAAQWRFGWTILEPSSPLVAQLDRAPDWRRIHSDDGAVVHARVR